MTKAIHRFKRQSQLSPHSATIEWTTDFAWPSKTYPNRNRRLSHTRQNIEGNGLLKHC